MILELAQEHSMDPFKNYDDLKGFRKLVIDAIEILQEDVEHLSEEINPHAQATINSNEIIATFDYSDTILQFLLEAHKTRHFEVIVVCTNDKHETSHIMVNISNSGLSFGWKGD